VSLRCGAFGIPEPNITWYKDGVELPGERSRTLVIKEVQLSDRGRYQCIATNFNPNMPTSMDNLFQDDSQTVVVNIKGNYSRSLHYIFISSYSSDSIEV
jgi:hypothetical protein